MSAAGNRTLSSAKTAKQDEFYTQLSDIENELKHYRAHFKGKVVLCNCDDPRESKFFEYFALNFNSLGLKKLITTSYHPSPIMGQQLSLFVMEGTREYAGQKGKRKAYVAEINEVPDLNKDGAINLEDVEHLLRHDKNATRPLKGDDTYAPGDFRSRECVELLKQADIVVTNPPFSLFREFVALLVEHEKQFLIISNKSALHYQEIFKLIKENKLWTGVRAFSGGMWFVADYMGKYQKVVEGIKLINVPAIWMTNLDNPKRHELLPLFKKYSPDAYPTYDNFAAIEVAKVSEIPCDYDGLMGVPDTFLDKFNPEQFELIGIPFGNLGKELGVTKNYRGRTDIAVTRDGKSRCPYSRIIIRRRRPQ